MGMYRAGLRFPDHVRHSWQVMPPENVAGELVPATIDRSTFIIHYPFSGRVHDFPRLRLAVHCQLQSAS